ncbi:efflux RND transporter periplasmic adaptor subunit [Allochromatium palmeri]|uniref:HlyD family efflux transporter periplasmic adaptor subunit n=1 Tax=Allochromatium palmeri TaxID=231048 RepID=A0A6N8EAV8_9GAMM|nr:efflux RND transporter periplasmic adaptor subunit [Allochromatium palmeri]MTW19667.1 HlyD family efflux transporter periplasmic adaptor subunit [Allochromatium palmeri]
MKKPLVFIGLLLLAAALVYLFGLKRSTNESDSSRLTLYGHIDVRQVDLAFEVSGRIESMVVSEGASVTRGEKLAQLDARRPTLAHTMAEARVEAQRAELRKLLAGARAEEIAKLRADLEATRTEATNARHHAERSKELAARKLVSPQDYDDARSVAEAAEARAGAVQASLDLMLAGTRAEDIDAARASLRVLEAELNSATIDLEETTLKASAAGVIQNRLLEPGDMASAQRSVFRLTLTEPLWARVYLAEPDLGRVKPGQPAAVFSDSFPGRAYLGWVGYIAPTAEFTPKTVQTTELRTDLVYQARVFVCNPRGELRQGMPVTVEIDLTAAPLAAPGCPAEPGSSQP